MLDTYRLALIGKMRQQGHTFDYIGRAVGISTGSAHWMGGYFEKPTARIMKPWPLRKATLSRGEMLALLEAGHSFEHVARAAGVTKQAIHYQFPGFKKEKSKADATWREEEYKQSAPYFRKLAREELRAAGWGKCYLQCREWHPPERMTRNRCKFCNTEHSRKVYAVSVGLEFIPNDPAVWWRQFETGEKRKRLVRRIRVDRRIKLPEREPVNLTQYEAEVYALVREGLPHSQIAEKLSRTKSAIRCAMLTVRRKAKQL